MIGLWLLTNRFAVIGFAFAAFICVVAFEAYRTGANRATAKIERQNAKAIANADTAGARSRDPKSRGVRDPYTRHD